MRIVNGPSSYGAAKSSWTNGGTPAVAVPNARPANGLLTVVLTSLGGRKSLQVFVLHSIGVALDQGEHGAGRTASVLVVTRRTLLDLADVEVLVLQHMDELVRECRAVRDIERRSANDDLLLVEVVEGKNAGLTRLLRDLEEVDATADEAERAEGRRLSGDLGACRGADTVPAVHELLERLVRDESHGHGMLVLKPPKPLVIALAIDAMRESHAWGQNDLPPRTSDETGIANAPSTTTTTMSASTARPRRQEPLPVRQ